jgi:hypothetical protein
VPEQQKDILEAVAFVVGSFGSGWARQAAKTPAAAKATAVAPALSRVPIFGAPNAGRNLLRCTGKLGQHWNNAAAVKDLVSNAKPNPTDCPGGQVSCDESWQGELKPLQKRGP